MFRTYNGKASAEYCWTSSAELQKLEMDGLDWRWKVLLNSSKDRCRTDTIEKTYLVLLLESTPYRRDKFQGLLPQHAQCPLEWSLKVPLEFNVFSDTKSSTHKAKPVINRKIAIRGKVVSNRLRRPKVSIVHIAGKANTKLICRNKYKDSNIHV